MQAVIRSLLKPAIQVFYNLEALTRAAATEFVNRQIKQFKRGDALRSLSPVAQLQKVFTPCWLAKWCG
jgi:hypothetical protein